MVITRFAPSDSGHLHIGGARTALINWLYAKKTGGKFVLRIEDSDSKKAVENSVESILNGLKWLGLDHDEEILFQSSRRFEHLATAESLIHTGKAYRDYATPEEVAAVKSPRVAYQQFSAISQEEQGIRADKGLPFVVRMRIPRDRETIDFHDEVFGDQHIAVDTLDDFVIVRSDGSPLFLLSCVLDDIHQGVNTVIRGQDHLSNTPKQVVIYEALGEAVPVYAHMALITTLSGEKLAKSKHGKIVDTQNYVEAGFLPEAVLQFMASLGFTDSERLLTLDDMALRLELSALSKSSAKYEFKEDSFDPKLVHLNAQWIREMPLEDLKKHLEPLICKKYGTEKLPYFCLVPEFDATLTLIRQRFWHLNDFLTQGEAYIVWNKDEILMNPVAVAKNLTKQSEILKALWRKLIYALSWLDPWDHDTIEAAVRQFCEDNSVKTGVIINALRTSLTGEAVGPSLFELIAMLPRITVINRMEITSVDVFSEYGEDNA